MCSAGLLLEHDNSACLKEFKKLLSENGSIRGTGSRKSKDPFATKRQNVKITLKIGPFMFQGIFDLPVGEEKGGALLPRQPVENLGESPIRLSLWTTNPLTPANICLHC